MNSICVCPCSDMNPFLPVFIAHDLDRHLISNDVCWCQLTLSPARRRVRPMTNLRVFHFNPKPRVSIYHHVQSLIERGRCEPSAPRLCLDCYAVRFRKRLGVDLVK